MMNNKTQGIIQQLRAQYPQRYQKLEEMKKNSTPEALLKQTLGKQTPEQRQQLYAFARKFGYSDDYLNQIENLLKN